MSIDQLPLAAPVRSGRDELARRMLAEGLGTGLLVTVVVGSGAAAQRLSPGDTGLQLLENSTATALGLTVLIMLFGPVSGAHFNPVVTLADWYLGRRHGLGLPGRWAGPYIGAQVAGAMAGAVLANLMFAVPAGFSSRDRSGGRLWLGEVVATTVLVLLVVALARTCTLPQTAAAVGAFIGAAYWFTSSTAFANPAVTIGRTLTGSFAGIAPASAPAFIAAQLVGGALAVALARILFPVPAGPAWKDLP